MDVIIGIVVILIAIAYWQVSVGIVIGILIGSIWGDGGRFIGAIIGLILGISAYKEQAGKLSTAKEVVTNTPSAQSSYVASAKSLASWGTDSNGNCRVCGGSAKEMMSSGSIIYYCESSGMYIWECFTPTCKHVFHMSTRPYGGGAAEYCPKCHRQA